MNERGFVKEGNFQQNKTEYGVKNLFRYADKFTISEKEVMQLFKDVPFLNGGLFDCLDKTNEAGTILYVDGFSRNAKQQATVPDFLFFSEEQEVDLNHIYGTKNKKHKVKGLVNLLESYKFTVAENTPIEEEIALDPELLGKVFENLLASYNPKTQTTARKQTGSFYTPREIINYMVDESLLEYLKQGLNNDSHDSKIDRIDERLRKLFDYTDELHDFNDTEVKRIIDALNKCKILDPACGSGAFPMGVLHKMVHILQKLDKENIYWKALQRAKAMEETETAYKSDNKEEREKRLIEINDVFENNASDYGRKLYLIENCIYGIDIQPIAVQIAKLRFFISLIIDQNKQEGKDNFGIRSLLNLETKFVAANTLIGLEIPTADLFLENNPIKSLQEELKNVRHLYFNAKTRKEKLQFQNRDKQLRKAMSEKIKTLLVEKNEDEITQIQADIEAAKLVLQKIEKEPERFEIIETTNLFGEKEQKKINKKQEKIKAQKDIIKLLENKLKSKQNALNKDAVLQVAENIASFDPYDQNHFADWFEPEWMFGKELENGFDIVIGNPPYGHTISEDKEYFSKHYISAEGKHEIFKYFIEKGLSLLSKNGMLSYITSDTWTSLGYFKKLRKLIYTDYCIKAISKSLYNVFETATVDTNIYFIEKSKPSSKYFLIDGDLKSREERIFEMNDEFVFNLKDENIIVKKIESSNQTLDEFCEIWQGLIAYGTKVQPREFTSDRKETKFHRKLLYGGDIAKYNIIWSGEYLKYGNWLHRPRPSYIYDNEKILVQRIRNPQLKNRLVCAIDSSGFLNGTGSSNILLKDKIKNPSLKYLLSLLNSKLINYWFSYYFIDVNIKPEQLRKIPIKTKDSEKQFISIVDQILSAKAENPKADTSALEKQLDEMVYKLYELTDEEIKIVEGK